MPPQTVKKALKNRVIAKPVLRLVVAIPNFKGKTIEKWSKKLGDSHAVGNGLCAVVQFLSLPCQGEVVFAEQKPEGFHTFPYKPLSQLR